MPTTRSTLRSGLERGSHQSKRKSSIGNADELETHKRHKDKITSDIDEVRKQNLKQKMEENDDISDSDGDIEGIEEADNINDIDW